MANIWQKAFSRIFWRNRDKGAPYTPLGESKLLPMDASIDEMDDRILVLNTTKAEQSDLLTAFKSVSFNSATGVFTFTKFNDTTVTVDTDIEKIAINFDYDDDPTSAHYQNLIITLEDGTIKYVDMSALLTQYEFTDSTTIHFTVTNGIVSANVINGSITSDHLSPTLNAKINNAEYYSEDSEAWAVGQRGGVDVPSTDETYENNAKYYALEAAGYRDNYVGTCTGQGANQIKVVTISSEQNFTLHKGAGIAVKFDANNTYSATAENPVKLNVNNTGAKQIYAGNSATPTGTNTTFFGRLNYYNYYVYDGTYWVWAGSSADNNTTYTPQALGFGYATCSTAAATAAKVATLSGYSLVTNGIVSVKFTNSVPANATLNINNRGAKNIYYQGAKIVAGVIKAGDIATFVYSGNYNLICIDRGSNGHTIVDSSGSQLASENSLQFADSFVSDDDVNGRTIVENIKEHTTKADYDQATEDGFHVIDDGNDVPIGEIEEDYVEVTADGNKTYTQLLTELKSGIDKTKLQYYSTIVLDKQTSIEVHNIVYWDTNTIVTSCVFTNYAGVTETDTFYFGKDNFKYQKTIVGNVTDMSSEKPSNGTKITLYYGTSSTVINLKTSANYCMMSDGETSVEGAIDNIADSGIWRHTVTATEAADSTIYVSPQAIKAGAKKIIPTGCVIDSQNRPCAYDNDNNVFVIFGMKPNDTITIYFVAIM